MTHVWRDDPGRLRRVIVKENLQLKRAGGMAHVLALYTRMYGKETA